MKISILIKALVNRLTPPSLAVDINVRKRVRMFVLSHAFGPVLGLPVPIMLFLVDPDPWPQVPVLAACILLFWALLYPLQRWPGAYWWLASFSIGNLSFAVLWAAYQYGGPSSPFLLWYVLVPLLAFFYLGSGVRAQSMILGQIVIGLGGFFWLTLSGDVGGAERLGYRSLVYAGVLSAVCSTIYTFLMASYYASVVDSHSDLIREVKSHKATLEKLTVATRESESARQLAEARSVELETAKNDLEHTVLHDSLTKLPNRRYLEKALGTGHAGGTDPRATGVLHLGLDRFKRINDTLGYSAGDAVLVHVAGLLTGIAGEDAVVARTGGDEFVVVCPGLDTAGALSGLAHDLIEKVNVPIPYNRHQCRVGASVGIAIDEGGSVGAKRLLVNSDIALHRAKKRGRNTVEVFSKALEDETARTSRIADDILVGLENGEFFAVYQPQVDANTFEVVGAEALVRWNHPKYGVLSPTAFLPVAEELSAVAAIDRLVLEHALADLASWRDAGVPLDHVSVNVSARRLNDARLIADLQEMKIPPGMVSFELVESIFLDETDAEIERNIDRLRDLGIAVEIDDFGTGHASIVSLLKLSPSRLKIDRQFIDPLGEATENVKLVASIIDMGKSLGIEVVAEGVEHMSQAHLLGELGCDVLQGYVFAPPLSGGDLVEFARNPPLRRSA